MPGLVPGIHVFGVTCKEDVDGRDKPGHDECRSLDAHCPHVGERWIRRTLRD
jgi:hypothetical protein